MSRWPVAPLKGHLSEISQRVGTGSAEVLSVTNNAGFVRSLDVFDKQVFSEDMSNYKVVKYDDIAYNPSRINVGSVARCDLRGGGAVSPMYVVVRCRESVLPQYLLYYLRSDVGKQHIAHRCVGAVRFQLRYADLEQLEVPLPPADEQERIVRILDEADRLQQLRADGDARIAKLAPALFDEMFGDSGTNPKGWAMTELGLVCAEIYRYPTFYGFDYAEIGVPVVRIGNINADGLLDPDLSHYVCIDSVTNQKYPRTILCLDDIVMAVRGDGSTGKRIGLVGSTNLVGANISPNLLRFKVNMELIEPYYLYYLMMSIGGQSLIERCITRAAKKTITARDIKGIGVPLPPLVYQREFSRRVMDAKALGQTTAASARRLHDLFQSLLHRAFQGEL